MGGGGGRSLKQSGIPLGPDFWVWLGGRRSEGVDLWCERRVGCGSRGDGARGAGGEGGMGEERGRGPPKPRS
jgi:hypothetical protein